MFKKKKLLMPWLKGKMVWFETGVELPTTTDRVVFVDQFDQIFTGVYFNWSEKWILQYGSFTFSNNEIKKWTYFEDFVC